MTSHASIGSPPRETAPAGRRILAGLVGGLGGGIVFGMLMAMMGLLTVIAGMVHSSSVVVGFALHLMISMLFGVIFGILARRWLATWGRGLTAGAVYGLILWVFGPLIMMPLMLGGHMFAVGPSTLLTLMGHLIFGVILAAITVPIVRVRR